MTELCLASIVFDKLLPKCLGYIACAFSEGSKYTQSYTSWGFQRTSPKMHVQLFPFPFSPPLPPHQSENLVFLLMNNFQASNKKEMMMFKTLESDTVWCRQEQKKIGEQIQHFPSLAIRKTAAFGKNVINFNIIIIALTLILKLSFFIIIKLELKIFIFDIVSSVHLLMADVQ